MTNTVSDGPLCGDGAIGEVITAADEGGDGVILIKELASGKRWWYKNTVLRLAADFDQVNII